MIDFNVLFLLLSLAIILVLIYFVLIHFKGASEQYPFKKKDMLFTEAEKRFLGVLDHILSDQFRIFGKVRVADVLSVASGSNRKEWWGAFNKINSEHFDYVVCDAGSNLIRAGIELDDSSHTKKHRQTRDEFLARACQAAGLPLIRIPVRKEYSISDIRSRLSEALSMDSAQANVQADELISQEDTEDLNTASPQCPQCSSAMVRRTVKSGPRAGQEFWGCTNFPRCRGIRDV